MRIAKLALLSAAMLAVAAPGVATAQLDREAEANAAFTVYPKESLERGEQGIVHYRVKIGRSGKPKVCEITRSSGYDRLDAATCNLLMDNARFTSGSRSTYDGRVHWRIS